MNCVIFTGGGLPEKKAATPYLKNVDFCVAADSGLLAAELFGFVPDLIVGDFDSLAEQGKSALLKKYPESKIRRWVRDKDYSDTEIALMAAAEEAQKRGGEKSSITLVGGSGGRADHFLALCALFLKPFHPDCWLCSQQIVYSLDSRGAPSKSLTLEGLSESDAVSVFSLPEAGSVPRVVSKGLHWELDGLDWGGGVFSLSNRIAARYAQKKLPVTITASAGNFLVTAPLEREC